MAASPVRNIWKQKLLGWPKWTLISLIKLIFIPTKISLIKEMSVHLGHPKKLWSLILLF